MTTVTAAHIIIGAGIAFVADAAWPWRYRTSAAICGAAFIAFGVALIAWL